MVITVSKMILLVSTKLSKMKLVDMIESQLTRYDCYFELKELLLIKPDKV